MPRRKGMNDKVSFLLDTYNQLTEQVGLIKCAQGSLAAYNSLNKILGKEVEEEYNEAEDLTKQFDTLALYLNELRQAYQNADTDVMYEDKEQEVFDKCKNLLIELYEQPNLKPLFDYADSLLKNDPLTIENEVKRETALSAVFAIIRYDEEQYEKMGSQKNLEERLLELSALKIGERE